MLSAGLPASRAAAISFIGFVDVVEEHFVTGAKVV